ncbi:hypothetical protein Amsp01_088530 [Amycolatopsis sp. NBRC 101858]|nr:hypothetical protein Amsp01_088530 [Amycolatopsis sp. NBRC 101858]
MPSILRVSGHLLFVEASLAATRDETLRVGIGDLVADFRARLAGKLSRHEVPDPEATAAVLRRLVERTRTGRSG